MLAGATEAAIARWLVAPGDVIAPGTPVAEIETEKALVEYQAEAAGIVGRLVLAEGETGEIGDPILVLVAEGETDADVSALLDGQDAPAGPPRAGAPASRVFASPLVRKLAGEKGLSLAGVEGTGPNGRVTRRDLERHLAVPAPRTGPLAAPAPRPADAPPAGRGSSRTRRCAARSPAA